jgi:quercetin dioxygenase-like cupin family protein
MQPRRIPLLCIKSKAVEMMIVDFPPRSASPAHRHPCPTFGYLISGEIVSVFEGKTYHYKAGDSFYETMAYTAMPVTIATLHRPNY